MSIRPKKYLSQNFLIDNNIINDIIKVSDVKENEQVIEIGPGRGALTKELIKYSNHIVAYELDNDLAEILENFLPKKKVKILNEDFLKANLEWDSKKVLVANIPYRITSKILFKIFNNSNLFDRAIIMLQKEVANRIVAKPGDNTYGKLSITSQYYSDVEIKIDVPSSSFYPAPKVNSAVLLFKFKKLVFDKDDEIKFLEFVKNSFRMPRKTLSNNLKKIQIKLEDIHIYDLKINKNSRPQDFSLDEYIKLFKIINNM